MRVVLAPLEVSGTGNLPEATEFAGEIFPAGATEGTYKFNTYKLSYRYTFVDKPKLRWRVGFTGVIRDANVELRQGNLQANDDNVGFVPALHLSSDYRFAERWMLRFDFDGLAGGPGRLFDVALKLDFAIDENWRIGGGYRGSEASRLRLDRIASLDSALAFVSEAYFSMATESISARTETASVRASFADGTSPTGPRSLSIEPGSMPISPSAASRCSAALRLPCAPI